MTTLLESAKSALDSIVDTLLPASPVDYVLQTEAADPDSFQSLMDAAGYRLAQIDTGVSVLPSRSMVFRLARELTEADILRMERRLRRHEAAHSGPLARIQRSIVRTLVDAQDLGGYRITGVTIALLPIPSISYTLSDGSDATSPPGAKR
jgi:hypothetical protein